MNPLTPIEKDIFALLSGEANGSFADSDIALMRAELILDGSTECSVVVIVKPDATGFTMLPIAALMIGPDGNTNRLFDLINPGDEAETVAVDLEE